METPKVISSGLALLAAAALGGGCWSIDYTAKSCTDHICPSGYRCDLASLTCLADGVAGRDGALSDASVREDASTAPHGADASTAEAGDAGGESPDATRGSLDASGGFDASTFDAGASCEVWANAQCENLSRCEPGTLRALYGGVSNCVTAEKEECVESYGMPGSGMTASWLDACSAFLQTSTARCDGGFAARPVSPLPCAIVGAGVAGTPCGINAQCASNLCVRTGSQCGKCFGLATTGGACTAGSGAVCGPGFFCDSSGACAPVVGVGDPCNHGVTAECTAGASCVSFDGGSPICVLCGAANGARCDPKGVGAPTCAASAGFFCNSSKVCQEYDYQAVGYFCGIADGGEYACSDSVCVAGLCTSPSALGQSCSLAGAGCSMGGICVFVDAGPTCTPVNPGCFPTDGGGT
jgi:hypothetical protein